MKGEGSAKDIALLEERRRQHQRQDAVRVRRCGGDAGADDAQVVQAGVRGVREGAGAGSRPTIAAQQPVGAH